ncbi:uncharacterized protein [Littorina saxatilis]|uniref:uncharacterized protein n=1 Tax=Littorina saxatilis TaxID=31220 RepID=UPI0038B6543A
MYTTKQHDAIKVFSLYTGRPTGKLMLDKSTCPAVVEESSDVRCECGYLRGQQGSPHAYVFWEDLPDTSVLVIPNVQKHHNGLVFRCRSLWGANQQLTEYTNYTLRVVHYKAKDSEKKDSITLLVVAWTAGGLAFVIVAIVVVVVVWKCRATAGPQEIRSGGNNNASNRSRPPACIPRPTATRGACSSANQGVSRHQGNPNTDCRTPVDYEHAIYTYILEDETSFEHRDNDAEYLTPVCANSSATDAVPHYVEIIDDEPVSGERNADADYLPPVCANSSATDAVPHYVEIIDDEPVSGERNADDLTPE